MACQNYHILPLSILAYSVAYWWVVFSRKTLPSRCWKEALGGALRFLLPHLVLVVGIPYPLAWLYIGMVTGAVWVLLRYTTWFNLPESLGGYTGIHLAAVGHVAALTYLFSKAPDFWALEWWRSNVGPLMNDHQFFQGVWYAIGFIWMVWGGTVFVRSVLAPFSVNRSGGISGEELQRGKVIGNLERLLIYLLIQLDMLGLITLTVGLKAVARFKKLEERDFAEYFLIGTLSSLLFAVSVAVLIKYLVRYGG